MKPKNENLINYRDELLKKIREDKEEDKEIVSNFDIEKESYRYLGAENRAVFIQACQWYKEQLKNKL
jgi:hypothetical protein